ncbi:hypothetical protein B0T20DRAFT_500500 [Sordaria brevicollis]|uniref:Rhodopsin domain-containing protein n=1 Tax=Sordaria brevicollis TaxID=83679 RepID=A0AAE0PBS3_SORBR|nr:hypothetical protein B0T20DRAFT_500500 [Sordaria brevicollis]
MLGFLAIATICMSLRFYSKRVSKSKYFLDDYVLIASWIVAIIYNSIALYMTRFGLGLELGYYAQVLSKERFYATPALIFSAITACWISKLSFFITLIRLVSKRRQKAMLWFLMTTSTASLLALSIMQSFVECGRLVPVLADRPGNFGKSCAHPIMTGAFSVYASVYATLMDFVLSLVPAFVIWKLKMKRAEKVAIICAMSTGCFAGGVSVLKVFKTYTLLFEKLDDAFLRYIFSGNYDSTVMRYMFKDPYKGGLVCALNSLEVSCTIIAASIPFFRPLIQRVTAKNNKSREEETVVMSAIPGSCRGHGGHGRHARLGSTSDVDGRKPAGAGYDDSVAILEVERKL